MNDGFLKLLIFNQSDNKFNLLQNGTFEDLKPSISNAFNKLSNWNKEIFEINLESLISVSFLIY